MIILIFTVGFFSVFLYTKSYRYLEQYYATVLYVSGSAVLEVLLCRGYMLWSHPTWWVVTDKLSVLIQITLLFPSTTVLFLRYLPSSKMARMSYFLGFFSMYVLMECLLLMRHEIVYHHGWSFGWSVFIDFCLFALALTHSRSLRVAVPMSVCIIVFLMTWFRVPLSG